MQKYNHNFQSMFIWTRRVYNINNYDVNRIKRSNQQKMAIGAFTAMLSKRRFTKASFVYSFHRLDDGELEKEKEREKTTDEWLAKSMDIETYIHIPIHFLSFSNPCKYFL